MPVSLTATQTNHAVQDLAAREVRQRVRNSRRRLHREDDPALALHGVARIGRHVDQRRLELAGIGIDEAGLGRQLHDDLDRRSEQRGEHVAQRLHALADVEHFGLQGLAPREGQQLRGQLGGARDRVRDRSDVALPPLLAQLRPVQQVDRGADHGQEIVEVVRDAAGELAQRLQPLAVLERLLGLAPLCGFELEMLGAPEGEGEQDEQQCRGGHAEHQMLAHGGEPARADRRGLEAGADIDRIFGDAPVADAPLDSVRWPGDGHQPMLGMGCDAAGRPARSDRAGSRDRAAGNAPAARRRRAPSRRSCRDRSRSWRKSSRNIPAARRPGSRR